MKQFTPILIWLISNFVGVGVVYLLSFAAPLIKLINNFYIITLIILFPISLAQWLALNYLISSSPFWSLTIPISFILAFKLIELIPDDSFFQIDDESTIAMTLFISFYGLILGIV